MCRNIAAIKLLILLLSARAVREYCQFFDELQLVNPDEAREEIVNEGYAIARLNGSAIYAPAANIIEIIWHYLADEPRGFTHAAARLQTLFATLVAAAE
ncbi:hypothetical protein [Candidatus Tokpelaia sp.]|uniref:hypothetical protein n=1 Tax=Candidatus Tokpelaia sp. TaxID=2233777 RepID=UPI00123B6656|nr:hypothetical protein [Candidatus Tokpelaia sp.]